MPVSWVWQLCRGVVCVACCALFALGGGVAAASPGPRLQATPAATRADRPLLAVSCSSARACIAVGGLFDERWNGRRWSVKPVVVPPFSQPALDFLSGVDCTTANVCMAVGTAHSPVAANVNYLYSALAEGWAGTSWTDQSPTVSQTSDGFFQAVSCLSASDCIAVGQGVTSALAMGWDGSTWTVQLAPVAPPVMSILNGVACTSAARCVAVGYTAPNQLNPPTALIEQWNGTAWTTVPPPYTSPVEPTILNAVSCISGSCTAVGSVGTRQLLERWNGQTWSIQPAPKRAGAVMNGVSCVSATDCVAVGGRTNSSHQSLAERWNGRRWSIEPTPTPAGGSILNGVSCPSARDCMAVGQNAGLPLLERWNGARWSTASAAAARPAG